MPPDLPGRGVTRPGSAVEVFRVFLLLGLTSFGGPVAHLGYFRDAFVVRRRWLGDRAYGDLVALCQFLPGPASSQVGMAIGLQRAGYRGMLAAWCGFTLPSVVLLVGFAHGVQEFGVSAESGWLRGLEVAAVAVVAHAVLGMARSLAPDRRRATIAVLALSLVLLVPTAAGQVLTIVVGALLGLVWAAAGDTPDSGDEDVDAFTVPVRRRTGLVFLACFAVLLLALPVLAAATSDPVLRVVDSYYRAGSLVFGGGHVVLPLLDAATVGTGLVDRDLFLAGYGAAQAVPGPLFTFAGYLGAVAQVGPAGPLGAALAVGAIFAPSALLVLAAAPWWDALRRRPRARRAVAGAGAAVVGLLAAALYDPVFTVGIGSPTTLAMAAAAFVALTSWKVPAWTVVLGAGLLGGVLL